MSKAEIKVNMTMRAGEKYWLVKLQWKEEGKWSSTTKSTGIPIKGNNKRKAQQEGECIRQEKEDELNASLKEDSCDIMFHEFLSMWLEQHKHEIRRSTYQSYESSVNNMLIPYFKSLKISLKDLSAHHIQKLYNTMLDEGKSVNTVKHYNAYLSSAIKLALKRNLIQFNPLMGVQLPKMEKRHGKAFTKDQLNEILKKTRNTPIGLVVMLTEYCGLRRSEVCGLEWSDIDFEDKVIHIRKTRVGVKKEIFEEKTKSASSRRDLPLDEYLEKVLLEEYEKQRKNRRILKSGYIDTDFVCVWEDGRPLPCHYVSKKFSKILATMGYSGYSFHSLRHTVGTLMSNKGNISLRTVQDYLGHSDIATTQIYVHPDWEAKKAASNVMSSLIGA